ADITRSERVLGIAAFSGTLEFGAGAPDIPVARVSMPVLPENARPCEVWSSDVPAEFGQHDRVMFRRTPQMLFGCITIEESEFARRDSKANGTHSALHHATARAYTDILATIDAESYPHLLRVWNYLPDINRDTHGIERYRQFNTARQDALKSSGRD